MKQGALPSARYVAECGAVAPGLAGLSRHGAGASGTTCGLGPDARGTSAASGRLVR